MGLFSRTKPKIKIATTKKDSFSGWVKCSGCSEIIHANELDSNMHCCPKCDYHYRISVKQRIEYLVDQGSFVEMFSDMEAVDPLNFFDLKSYKERLKKAKEESKRGEAVAVGRAAIEGTALNLAVLDFGFMGGSMGSVVGEKLTLLIEDAMKNELPLMIISASGGARMQESILSLMQMAKTAAALTKLNERGLLYISVLTNPTTGGVTASFASLGDIIVAEPGALIGFAGPRVVEKTIGEKLPPGAQRSEFLLKKGMIDMIIRRVDLKKKLAFFVDFFKKDVAVQKLEQLLQASKEEKIKIFSAGFESGTG